MKHATRTYARLCFLAVVGFMPMALAAPNLDVISEKYASGPGEAFPIAYRIFWDGDPAEYTVLPPALPVLEWGKASLLEVRSRKTGDVNEIRLVVGYTSENTGVFEAPSFDIRVLEWNDGQNTGVLNVSPETPAQVLGTPPVKVTVRRSRLPWAAAAVTLSAVTIVLAAVYIRRRNRAKRKQPEASPLEEGMALLHEARRHRLDGDFYAFYCTLRRACDLAGRVSKRPNEHLIGILEQRIKDTGYRGLRPSEDNLEGDFKEVEQQITRMHERP